MVTRLRLIPGQSARICAAPMIVACLTVRAVRSRRPGRGFHHTRKTPPTSHAATTRPGSEQAVLDAVTQEQPDDRCRDERDDQTTEQSASVDITTDHARSELTEAAPVEHDDREDRTDLDGDGVRVRGSLGVAVAEAEQPLGDEQVAGR